MGLLSLFGVGPLSPGKIDKVSKLAANPFAQPDVRMREMQRLVNDGSPLALRGLLKRFASNANGHIADEDEKQWLEDKLVDIGSGCIEPLAEFIHSGDKLTYALRAYERIAGEEAATAFFIKVMNDYGPDDHRSLEAKLQLVWALGEHLSDPRVLPALVPFLVDHSDDVRWAILDLVVRAKNENLLSQDLVATVAEKLGDSVSSDAAAPRIQRRAAELLADYEWAVPGEFESLTTFLEPDFFLDKKRFVRRRVKKA